MEELRHLAWKELDERIKFQSQPCRLTLVTMKDCTEGENYQCTVDTENAILSQVSQFCSTRVASTPSLTLVSMMRESGGFVDCSRDAFVSLATKFHVDPYTLRLAAIGAAGLFHEDVVYESRYTYYVGAFCYTLMWTFDPSTMHTCAIFMPRRNLWIKKNSNPVEELGQLLQLYHDHLFSPVFLMIVVHMHLFRMLDELIDAESHIVRHVEGKTLHGSQVTARGDLGIDALTNLARLLDDTLGHLHDLSRHLDVVDTMSDFLQAELLETEHRDVKESIRLRYDRHLNSLVPALRILKKQTAAARAGADYFRERGKSQYSVVFALLTHKDAQINISQAEASWELARASKEDSSSMKTIAVMTMAFLPATFFAALFAVPTLQWDQTGVIQENFWVYWAFTIPATVIVFFVWVVLNKWPLSQTLNIANWRHARSKA